jgi:hypothetical protein
MSNNIISNVQLVPLEILLKNHSIGFKIVPIYNDSKTPAIKSTNEVYDNPEYWTIEKIKQEH